MDRLKTVIISPQTTINQALKKMDEAAKRILIVTDKQQNILGVVSDGDIRRWILKGSSLEEKVDRVMNTSPFLLKDGYLKEEAKQIMVSQQVECIPVVDENKKLVSAVWWLDFFDDHSGRRKIINVPIIIMAGGEGTRLAPFTHILPKPLMPIGEKPIIEAIIDKFVEYGCRNFYISVNYKANMLKAHFDDFKHDYKISYIKEDKPLGTIGSIYMLKNKIKETFFISNCDILIEADYADILEFHKKNKNDITMVVSLKHYTIPYGVCDIENGGMLKGIKEKPEYDLLVNTGLYLMEENVLQDIPENTFLNLTDLIDDYINKGKKVGVYPISDKSWFDMGQWQGLQNMVHNLGMK